MRDARTRLVLAMGAADAHVPPLREAGMKPGTRAIHELLIAAGPDGLTPLDALREAGCFRLAARVAELRHDGYDVRTAWETDADGTRWARYVLIERPVPTTGVQEGLAL